MKVRIHNVNIEDLSKYGIDAEALLTAFLTNEVKKAILEEKNFNLEYYQKEFDFNMNIYNKNIDHRIGKAALQNAQADLFKIIELILNNIHRKYCE